MPAACDDDDDENSILLGNLKCCATVVGVIVDLAKDHSK